MTPHLINASEMQQLYEVIVKIHVSHLEPTSHNKVVVKTAEDAVIITVSKSARHLRGIGYTFAD